MTSSVRSILDKPLTLLTEDDISQLTREDCRKFLKDKGMRRPSWNKSQAIQQVISLKALLEGSQCDSGARTLRRIVENPPRENSNSADSGKGLSATANVSEAAEDLVHFRRRDPPEFAPQGDAASLPVEPDRKAASPRSVGASEDPIVGQMTIFYCGQVNVYDGVSPDKAKSIMQLAASTVHTPQDESVNGSPPMCPLPCRVQASSDNLGPSPPHLAISNNNQTEKAAEFTQQHPGKGNCPRELDVGQFNRKASLQKYLEKRKDRGRFKSRKDGGSASSNMEMYLNHHQVRTPPPVSSAQLRKSTSRSSPPQPGTTTHEEAKMVCLSVDLNEEGI